MERGTQTEARIVIRHVGLREDPRNLDYLNCRRGTGLVLYYKGGGDDNKTLFGRPFNPPLLLTN